MIEPLPRIDWSSADRAVEDLRSKMNALPEMVVGVGLGQNGDAIDNLQEAIPAPSDGTPTVFYFCRNGEAWKYRIPAEDLGAVVP